MTKNDLISGLNSSELFSLAQFLVSEDAKAKTIGKFLDIIPTNSDIDDTLVLVPLAEAGVLKRERKDEINSSIEIGKIPVEPELPPVEPEPELPYKTYTVNVEGNINEWINANAIPSGGGYIVIGNQVTLRGTLPIPAEEVI